MWYSAGSWSVHDRSHQRNLRKSTFLSGSCTWWNIGWMSAMTATVSFLNQRRSPIRELVRSGPCISCCFSEVPLYIAPHSNTALNFPWVWWSTPWWGMYHTFQSSCSNCSGYHLSMALIQHIIERWSVLLLVLDISIKFPLQASKQLPYHTEVLLYLLTIFMNLMKHGWSKEVVHRQYILRWTSSLCFPGNKVSGDRNFTGFRSYTHTRKHIYALTLYITNCP